jgi:hypothetical protein
MRGHHIMGRYEGRFAICDLRSPLIPALSPRVRGEREQKWRASCPLSLVLGERVRVRALLSDFGFQILSFESNYS